MKKNKISVLLLALLTAVLLLTFAACSSFGGIGDQGKDQITDVKMLDNDTGYGLKNGKVVITYDGENWIRVPRSETLKDSYELTSIGFYITPEVTAVAYGGYDADPVKVLITENKGKKWTSAVLPDNKAMEPDASDQSGEKFIGFTNSSDGWIITTGQVAMGSQNNFVYKTADGGKTWVLEGSTDDIYSRVVTGAGFANKDTGFICFRYEDQHNPVVYITQDGGKTWKKQDIQLPSKYKDDYATPLSPVFQGANGRLPVTLSNSGNKDYKVIQYTSSDYGIHWTAPEE